MLNKFDNIQEKLERCEREYHRAKCKLEEVQCEYLFARGWICNGKLWANENSDYLYTRESALRYAKQNKQPRHIIGSDPNVEQI